MNDVIRPLFENALKKAKDIHVVMGALFIAFALGIFALGIFIPAKSANDKLGKIGMMFLGVVFLAGGAYKVHLGRKLEKDIRKAYDAPGSVQGLKFLHIDRGLHKTYEIHLGVSRKKPVLFPVLNWPDAERMQQFAITHFTNAKPMP